MQKDKAGALILEFPPKQSVTAAKRRVKRELEGQPIEVKFSDAFLDAGEAVESNAREIERLLPSGHPALDSLERLSMIATYLIDCSEIATDQGF